MVSDMTLGEKDKDSIPPNVIANFLCTGTGPCFTEIRPGQWRLSTEGNALGIKSRLSRIEEQLKNDKINRS